MEYINTDWHSESPNDKQGILDMHAKQADGTQVNIEIQVYPIETMVHRSLFYWSRMYFTQLSKGEPYGLLKPCIAINIVNFAMTPLDSAHTTWHITEDHTGEQLSDLFEMHFIGTAQNRQRRKRRQISQLNAVLSSRNKGGIANISQRG